MRSQKREREREKRGEKRKKGGGGGERERTNSHSNPDISGFKKRQKKIISETNKIQTLKKVLTVKLVFVSCNLTYTVVLTDTDSTTQYEKHKAN